jgi:hypothetical protein
MQEQLTELGADEAAAVASQLYTTRVEPVLQTVSLTAALPLPPALLSAALVPDCSHTPSLHKCNSKNRCTTTERIRLPLQIFGSTFRRCSSSSISLAASAWFPPAVVSNSALRPVHVHMLVSRRGCVTCASGTNCKQHFPYVLRLSGHASGG